MRRSRIRLVSLALNTATASVLTAAASALGADTWDNGSILSPGQWSVGDNWADNTVPTSTDAVTFPTPILGGSTITLSAGEEALSLTINDNYTLTAGSLTLAAGGSVSVASGRSATISSVLSGGNGLTKSGAGTLVLGGANIFTGGIAINAGTLSTAVDSRLGNASNGVTINGGTLATTGTFSSGRTISMGASGGTIAPASGTTLTITSALTANANALMIPSGSGSLELS